MVDTELEAGPSETERTGWALCVDDLAYAQDHQADALSPPVLGQTKTILHLRYCIPTSLGYNFKSPHTATLRFHIYSTTSPPRPATVQRSPGRRGKRTPTEVFVCREYSARYRGERGGVDQYPSLIPQLTKGSLAHLSHIHRVVLALNARPLTPTSTSSIYGHTPFCS